MATSKDIMHRITRVNVSGLDLVQTAKELRAISADLNNRRPSDVLDRLQAAWEIEQLRFLSRCMRASDVRR